MKLTKKVLSIILAAALVLGSVAVAANAAVVTGLAGSVLTMNITSDKDVADGKAEVKPGETITVSVAYTTNFYPGNAGVDLFVWTKGVFDDAATVATMVAADDYWEVLANFPLKSGYPSDYPATGYSGYLNTRSEMTDYVGSEIDVLDDEVFYTFKFTVPEDAAIGSVVDFVAPQSKVYSGSGSTRGFIRQNVGDSSTYDVVASSYCETVNVDSLQITVVEDKPVTPDEPDVPEVVDPVYGLEGSVLTMDVTSDKDVSNGYAEVKPGEKITVSVAYTTNFYPGNAGVDLFVWTKGIFDDSKTVATMVGADDYWEVLANFPLKSGYPSDYPATGYSGYLNTRSEMTDYVGGELELLNKEVFYTFEFTVPEDAEIGSIVDFVIPQSKVYSGSGSTRGFIRQNVSDSSTYDVVASSYCETVNVDSLQIKVVAEGGTEPEPPVVEYADLAALQAAIAAAESADTTNCTDKSVAALEQALAAAKALNVEGTLKSEQDKINAAVATLNAAVEGLDKLDFSALNAQIARFEEADNTIYTDDSWADASDAYNVAKAISTADTQADINAAAANLKNALDNLVEYGKVNYTALNDAMAAYTAKLADKDNYTNWAGYEALYNAAKAIDQSVVYDKNGEQKAADDAAAALNGYALVEYDKVDYTALNDAIAAYDAKVADKDLYANWAEYEAAYNAAKAIDQSVVYNKNGEQKAADDAAAALNAVVLAYKDADYSAVEQAKNIAAALDPNVYTADSLKAVDDAVNAVVYGLDITNQAEVNAMADAINDAIGKLVPLGLCDYSGIDNALVAAQAYVTNKDNYTPDSWTASGIDAAYSAAFAIATGDKLIADEAGANQAKIDAAAKALTDACAELVLKADKSALEAAIARAGALVETNYTPDSWAAADLANVLAAANVVLADPNATADAIAAQVAAIEAAEAKLVIKADKEALELAILNANAKIVIKDTFTPASYNESNIEAVKEAALVVFRDENATAQQVADAIAALAAAEAKLVEKADKTALEAAINTEVKLENATEETIAAYRDALAAAQDVLADDNATEDAVLTATNNLLAAIDGIDYYGACDYTAYNEAVAAANALVEADYTTSSWAAADIAAVLAANAVEEGLLDKDGNQDKIDAAAEAINAAIALLEKKADVSALEAAVEAVAKVAEEFATEDSWKAYAEAKAAAEALLANAADLGVSKADEIAAAAQALVDANAALVEKDADYTAVEEALAYVATKGELNQYTQASVKKLQAAIDAVVYGLGISKQDEVDAAADAIVKAADELAISQAAVTNVEVDLDEYYERAILDYTITVTGAPSKIQVVEPNGSTITFDRYNRYIKIESYNEAGEIVDYAEEAPAYEKWTVSMNLGEGTHQAKAKFGSVWEVFAYDFTVEFAEAADPREAEVIFVAKLAGSEAEAGKTLTATAGAVAEVTVIVPDTVTKIKVSYPTFGNDATFTREMASVVDNGDGTCTWTIARNVAGYGKHKMTLSLRDKYGWYEPNTEDIDLVVDYVEEVDNREAEVTMVAKPVGSEVEAGATLAIALGTAAEVTVVVPNSVVKIQLSIPKTDGTATYTAANSTVVDNGDGTSTWTVIRNISLAGSYDLTLKLKDSKGWYDSTATIAVECE